MMKDKKYLERDEKNNEEDEAPFSDKVVNELYKLKTIGVTFVFNKIKFSEKCRKRSHYLNSNYVVGMNGTAFLTFGTVVKMFSVQISGEDGVEWLQERTSNMDPPKQIKDEIIDRWKHPEQGYGLIGLGLKKLRWNNCK